jgi:hypothetical protein
VLCIVLYGVFIIGCDSNKNTDTVDPNKSACKGFVYDESGLTFGKFRPCAGEMIGKLEEITPHLKATLEGDREARKKGIKTLRELTALIKGAGGYQKLLGGWEDNDLNTLIIEIINAYNHYDAFFRVTMIGSDSPSAKQEFKKGKEALKRAKWEY